MGRFSSSTSSTVKIPLSQIREGANVRREYDRDEIRNLARSIQVDGLLNPLTVRPGSTDPETGLTTHEIICGHRRLRALALLQQEGVDVGPVECCVRTGESWTLQMVENVQRTDLSAQDKEAAVKEMLDAGLSVSDIADKISKPCSYVTDILAGAKVRREAEAAGIDTEKLGTRALAQLRSVDAASLPGKVRELAESGGTNAAATRILHEYQEKQNPRMEIPADQGDDHPSAPDPFEISENPAAHVSSKKEDFGRKKWKEWEAQTSSRLSIGISFENITDAKRCLELIQNGFPNIVYATKLFW